ncbi:MAG: hypothetical protein NC827_05930 [Candidatus Omnitrophica bacterium]|nr:hypothetical protein [Candidatus Omnitrophota bacterium]
MKETVLKIDIDYKPNQYWLNKWIKTRKFILERMKCKVLRTNIFETKRGFHAYFVIDKKLNDNQLNMLQFLLGDDATRVKINEWRIKRGIRRWNKLFSKILWRKKAKAVRCWYCGNVIPLRD